MSSFFGLKVLGAYDTYISTNRVDLHLITPSIYMYVYHKTSFLCDCGLDLI